MKSTRKPETSATKQGADLLRRLVRGISAQLGKETVLEERTLPPRNPRRKTLSKAELELLRGAIDEIIRHQDARKALDLMGEASEAGEEGLQAWWNIMQEFGQVDAKALPIACTVALALRGSEQATLHLENGWKLLSEGSKMLARTQVGARERQEAIARFVNCVTGQKYLDNHLALLMLTTLMSGGDLDGMERVISCKGRDKNRHAFFLSCNKLVQEHGDPLAEEIRAAWQGTSPLIIETLAKTLLTNARDKSPHKNWQSLLMEKYHELPYSKRQEAGRKSWDWLLDIASVKNLDAHQSQALSECMDGLFTPGLMLLDAERMVQKLEHAMAGGNKNALTLAKHLLHMPNLSAGTDPMLMHIVQRLGREVQPSIKRHLESSLEELLRAGHLFSHEFLAGQKGKWKKIGLEINEKARLALSRQ